MCLDRLSGGGVTSAGRTVRPLARIDGDPVVAYKQQAMKLIDAMVATPIDFVRLPLIAVLGALAYGEALDPMVFVGAAIIFAGTPYSLAAEHRTNRKVIEGVGVGKS